MNNLETNENHSHAGALRRLLSGIIDGIPIMLILVIFIFSLAAKGVINTKNPPEWLDYVFLPAGFLYYLFFLSSKKQATLGMIIMKIKLTDVDYNKPTFKKCFYMTLVMFLPIIIGTAISHSDVLPFYTVVADGLVQTAIAITALVMIAITRKKQAFWDMIAGTYAVISK